MKKINIKFDIKKLLSAQKKSDWKKSIYIILIIATFGYVGLLVFIYLKPATQIIKDQVEEQISNDQIKIDTKVLNSLKLKDYPNN